MAERSKKSWFITGCSSGFGRVLAEAALGRGDSVLLTARDPSGLTDLAAAYPSTARTAALDVTASGAAAAAATIANDAFGGIDVLVNNAGYGLIGALEEVSPEEYRPMFETNLFGMIETTRAVLPYLRGRPGSRVVNISSGGGIVGRAGFGLYNGTKFAMEGVSEALAEELQPFGIAVIIVEPGAFRTGFLGRSIAMAKKEMPEYASTSGASRRYRETDDGNQAGDPVRGMALLLEAVDAASPPLRLPLGKAVFGRIRAKHERLLAELGQWEAKAAATDFAE